MNLKQAAWFSAVPWGTMAISGYVAGAASDFLIKAGYSLTFVRKVMQVIYRLLETGFFFLFYWAKGQGELTFSGDIILKL